MTEMLLSEITRLISKGYGVTFHNIMGTPAIRMSYELFRHERIITDGFFQNEVYVCKALRMMETDIEQFIKENKRKEE